MAGIFQKGYKASGRLSASERGGLSSLPKLFSCFLLVVFLSFPSPSGKRVSACPLKKEVLYAVYPTPGSADREAVGSAL